MIILSWRHEHARQVPIPIRVLWIGLRDPAMSVPCYYFQRQQQQQAHREIGFNSKAINFNEISRTSIVFIWIINYIVPSRTLAPLELWWGWSWRELLDGGSLWWDEGHGQGFGWWCEVMGISAVVRLMVWANLFLLYHDFYALFHIAIV